jgi:hypothetical protein
MRRLVQYGIYLNHEKIGEAWFDVWEYPSHCREVLINTEGYDSAIKIRSLRKFLTVTEKEFQEGVAK